MANLWDELKTIAKWIWWVANPAAMIWNKIGSYIGEKINNSVNPTYSNTELMSWNRYSTTWMANLLNSESTIQRKNQINKQLDNIANKHETRMNIASWNVTSWNKNADKLEKARSALADYARVSYLNEAEKDKSMDLWVLDKMKDQDIIDWLTKDDDNAQKVYIDFVNNGWAVWDVYNKIMWIDKAAEKEEERLNSSSVRNYFWWLLNELPNQVAWVMDIMWLSDLYNKWEKERAEKYNQLNTDEYNKLMNWQISWKDIRDRSGMYFDYDKAVKEWKYVWSVEDYARDKYNQIMWDSDRTFQDRLKTDSLLTYNEEWKWADAGKYTTQWLEFLTMSWGNWWFFKNLLVWTAEILWIDAASEWKLPTAWEAWVTTAANWILEAIFGRFPWGKWLQKQLAWMTPEVKEALGNTTKEMWTKYSDVVSQWLKKTKEYATELLDKAAWWLKEKLSIEWGILEWLRKTMKWDFKYEDFFDSINKKFKNFEKEWWDKNAVPEIKIGKDGSLEIYNEEALSNLTDVNWQKLTDMIKSEWEAFRNQARKWDIRDVETLMRNMETKIYEATQAWGIKSTDSTVKAFLEWTKDAYEKLYEAMWDRWQLFKTAREKFHDLKQYEEFFDKYIGNIRLWSSPLDKLEKTAWWEKAVTKWTDVVWDLLSLLKDNDVISEDIKSQLIWLVYAFWIKNPKQVQKLLEGIYPSMPWIQEIWLELFRQRAKSKYAESMLKDATNEVSPREQIKRAIGQTALTEYM